MKKTILLSLALLPLWLFAQVPTRPTPAQLQQAAANTNDVLTWNGSAWAPAAPSGTTNLTYTGASSPVTLNSSTGSDVTIVQGGIVTLSATGTALTISATEVDGSVTNEGSLSVSAGGSNDSQIASNTSGSTNVTIAGGTGVQVTESGSTITIAATGTTLNAQTGTTYTLVLGDAGKFVTMSNASANTLTIPPNSSVAFAVGTVVNIAQGGAGQTTIAPGSGVTLNSAGAALKTRVQYSSISAIKTATDTWLIVGDITN